MNDTGGRPRGPLLAIVLVLLIAALGLVAWIALPTGPEIGKPPPGVLTAQEDGIVFAVGEFKVGDRKLITTLDLPRGRFQGAWSMLERDPEMRLWIRYGGEDRPAIIIQATPIPVPEGARIDRIVLTGYFDKTPDPPAPGESVEAGLRIPAGLLRRAAPLSLSVKGVEKIME